MSLRKGRSYDLLPESCPIFLCDFDPFGARAPLYTLEIACRECVGCGIGPRISRARAERLCLERVAQTREGPRGEPRDALPNGSVMERGCVLFLRQIARMIC